MACAADTLCILEPDHSLPTTIESSNLVSALCSATLMEHVVCRTCLTTTRQLEIVICGRNVWRCRLVATSFTWVALGYSSSTAAAMLMHHVLLSRVYRTHQGWKHGFGVHFALLLPLDEGVLRVPLLYQRTGHKSTQINFLLRSFGVKKVFSYFLWDKYQAQG